MAYPVDRQAVIKSPYQTRLAVPLNDATLLHGSSTGDWRVAPLTRPGHDQFRSREISTTKTIIIIACQNSACY